MSLEFAEQRSTSMYMSPKSTYMIRLGLVFQLKVLWFFLLYKNQTTLLGIARTIDYENLHFARTPLYLTNFGYDFFFGNKSRIYLKVHLGIFLLLLTYLLLYMMKLSIWFLRIYKPVMSCWFIKKGMPTLSPTKNTMELFLQRYFNHSDFHQVPKLFFVQISGNSGTIMSWKNLDT